MQKTAYEMRISDWSSDVCSSDLHDRPLPALRFSRPKRRKRSIMMAVRTSVFGKVPNSITDPATSASGSSSGSAIANMPCQLAVHRLGPWNQAEWKSRREGKRVAVVVRPGGWRNLKKKQ